MHLCMLMRNKNKKFSLNFDYNVQLSIIRKIVGWVGKTDLIFCYLRPVKQNQKMIITLS